ncbi:hypothetical protein GBA52_002049 [Prunus armeniaca]|nr:hypothetical protein GBA52_002049 [Prunus armeniaca]
MAPPPGPYSGTSTLALVARASAFTFGLVYGSVKLRVLKDFKCAFDFNSKICRFQEEGVKDIKKEIELETKEKRNGREQQHKEREEDRRKGRDRYSEGDRDRDRHRHRGGRDRDGRERRRERYDRDERRRDTHYNDDGDDRGRHTDRYNKHKRDGYEDDGDVKEDGDDRRGNRDRWNGQNHSDEPKLYQVYKGRISRVMDTGCFVQLNDLRRNESLVHVSQMATRRISNAKDVVKRDQEVYVKVISISGQKLSLSMRDVDQYTGKDLLPLKYSSKDDALRTNPSFSKDGPVTRTGLSGIRIVEEDDVGPSRWPLKRMSSPEKWEAKQLIALGVLGVTEYPMYDE